MNPIYFDNAATSFPKPPAVIREVSKCLRKYCANPGRSTHSMAAYSAERVYETREAVSDFLNLANPEGVVYAMNATHALNIAIKGLIRHKCHVITSDIEHNSVSRPLSSLTDLYGVEVSKYNSSLPISDAITPLLRDDTEFIVTTAASNVTGKVIDIAAVSKIAKEHGIITIIDASQLLGHSGFDARKLGVDAVCAPAHKALLGMQGCGFAAFGSHLDIGTIIEGGGGGDTFNLKMPERLPERLEAGTLNLPAIVALYEGVRYIQEIGTDAVEERIDALTERARDVLHDVGATIYGAGNGIASFEHPKLHSGALATLLDEEGIAVRSGLHCAPDAHKKLGTERRGLVRLSFSVFNTAKELDRLWKVLRKIK